MRLHYDPERGEVFVFDAFPAKEDSDYVHVFQLRDEVFLQAQWGLGRLLGVKGRRGPFSPLPTIGLWRR